MNVQTKSAMNYDFRVAGSDAKRLKALPKSAQAKFEHLRRIETRARAMAGGLHEETMRVRDRRDDALRVLAMHDRDHAHEFAYEEDESTGTRKRVPARSAERNAIVAQIEGHKAELERLHSEQSASRVGFSTDAIFDFLRENQGSTFRMASVPKSTKDLVAIREAQAAIADEIAAIEAAPRTIAELKALARAEVNAIAEKGQPNINLLRQGGAIQWPMELQQAHGYGAHEILVSAEVKDGFAFAMWANRDAIIARLEKQFEAEGNGANALTASEQAKRIAECKTKLLQLQRSEETIIERMESAGQVVTRLIRDPLVLLGIEAV